MISIYQEAMGRGFGRLQPELREYFGLHAESGLAGFGRGVFDVAGCTAWFARPAFRLTALENAFFPEYNSDVPFTIRNYPHLDPFGRPSLTARRELDFGTALRIFEDTTSLQDGVLTDYVGRHRRMATLLTCTATREGRIRMVSSQTRIFAGLRLPLPDVVGALAYVEQWWDDATGLFRITTRVVHRQLGTLLVYAGSFDYTLEEFDGVLPEGARPDRWEARV
ncbi:DUF4166 domain-containing protein [Arthrobacter echini]|uniref:DUF4166 domain-containing protein n=1 Tax=Arthrobacter echini TaxID=1529066 RepID=A0A5D0XLM3_9MICC|nr:DUF4166 domain-containing protein [Arthrobacter echini]TYC97464.1 DUF4166 domain-containing protein [Arthrobacter echini]